MEMTNDEKSEENTTGDALEDIISISTPLEIESRLQVEDVIHDETTTTIESIPNHPTPVRGMLHRSDRSKDLSDSNQDIDCKYFKLSSHVSYYCI
jgi:hypothetical protein